MLILLTLPMAVAAPPDDEAVRALVSKTIGKEVPAKFLCIERPVLPSPFEEPVIVAGIKVKGKGCVSKGVILQGRLSSLEESLPIALGTRWPTLEEAEREDTVKVWTREVLLTFQQPQSQPEVSRSGATLTTTTNVLSRSGEALVAAESEHIWAFDKAGTASQTTTTPTLWRSTLVLHPNSAKGLDVEEVSASIDAVGKLFERCFRAAWQHDLSIKQRTRLTWTIDEDGKATSIAARQQSSGRLSQCYATALSRADFPSTGTVDFEFGIRRTKVLPSASE